VLFRATDLNHAATLFSAMTDLSRCRLENLASGLQLDHLAGLLILVIFVNVAPTTKQWIERGPLETRRAVLMALLFCVSLYLIRDVQLEFAKSEFIYFQF